MNVVLTGGSGFLGKHVQKACVASGVIPRALGRKDGDMRDPLVARRVLADAEVVVHLAADVGGVAYLAGRQAEAFHANHRIGINVIQAACFHRCRRLILIGSPCSYGPNSRLPLVEKSLQDGFPTGETGCYGLAKLVVSETANLFGNALGIETVTLIPGNIYGPSDHFECNRSHVVAAVLRRAVVSQLLGRETFSVWGNGSATRDFVYVDDVARTIAQVVTSEHHFSGDVFNIGSGSETSVRQLADLVAETVGGGIEPEFIEEELVGYTHRILSNELARSVLGYQPKISLQDGLFETLAWVRREGLDRVWLEDEVQESGQPLQLFGGSGSRRAA
mgnify:FL=1|tara:strand:+ start:165 stop:1166 length:1002 start_codon:yes stop_codon:yes gene_type:complete